MSTKSRQSGFTAIELLVVIAIIAVLIALLLPAVQQARESARRTQCRNNMMQIGLAMHSYHQTHQTLPPGTVNSTGPVKNDGNGYYVGWMVQVLPYLDEQLTYRKIDFAKSIYDDANNEPIQHISSVYRCPSSPGSNHNYAGCHNDTETPIDTDNNGVLYLNSRVRFRDVTDGRRATILFGEVKSVESWAYGTRSTLRNMSGLNSLEDLALYSDRGGVGRSYYDPSPDPQQDESEEDLTKVGGFMSWHSDGVHFCMVDGSVHFLSQRMDRQVLLNLANRHDGNLLEEF